MTNDETTVQLSSAIDKISAKSSLQLPDRFEFEVEIQHHTDKNHRLIGELKSLLCRRGYCIYEAWNEEFGTKRFTFYKPPGPAPY